MGARIDPAQPLASVRGVCRKPASYSMNFDLLRILEPSKKAGLRIPAHFLENAGSPGSAYNFKCVLPPASCFLIRNLGCCGSARKNAGSRKQGARPTFLNPASCKNPLSRCVLCGTQCEYSLVCVSPAICTHNARILAASGDLDSHDPPAAAGRRWGSEISERPLPASVSDRPGPGGLRTGRGGFSASNCNSAGGGLQVKDDGFLPVANTSLHPRLTGIRVAKLAPNGAALGTPGEPQLSPSLTPRNRHYYRHY